MVAVNDLKGFSNLNGSMILYVCKRHKDVTRYRNRL